MQLTSRNFDKTHSPVFAVQDILKLLRETLSLNTLAWV